MNVSRWRSALDALQTSTRSAERARLVDELTDARRVRWYDARHEAELTRIAARVGVALPHPWTPRPHAPGETWLLLYAPEARAGIAARAQHGADARARRGFDRAELDRVARGLLSTVARACRRWPAGFDWHALSTHTAEGFDEVTGGSLGLASCVAWVSSATGRAPRMEVAGSAAVRADGALGRVDFLGAKLRALRDAHPYVTRVVVAREQPAPDEVPEGITLLPRDHLGGALEVYGLTLDPLPRGSIERYRARAAEFSVENMTGRDAIGWASLAREAWEVSNALLHPAGDARLAHECLAWAALFSLHAGDAATADAYLRPIPAGAEVALDPRVDAWRAVVDAARAIDIDPTRAVALAEAAVLRAREAAPDGEVLGHALGTRGRALLHAGRLDEAEAALREALAFFQRVSPREAPRSTTYLATCLRMRGRGDEGLALLDAADDPLRRDLDVSDYARTTREYLKLERGRCLQALGRHDEALDDFAYVERGAEGDVCDPRLRALRGMARSLRALGRDEEADAYLKRCLSVAESPAGMLARVAAVAAGEAMLDGVAGELRARCADAWARHWPDATTDEAVRAALAAWVY